MERISELRIFFKATNIRVNEIEKEPGNKDEMMREKALLKAIKQELKRLEQRAFISEMGL
jgi:hypothetical protein